MPRCRPQPEIPVDLVGRRRFTGEIAGLGRSADRDVDGDDVADLAGPHRIDDAAVVAEHPLTASGEDAAVATGRRDHQRSLAEGERLRFLEIDVLRPTDRPRS